MLYPFKLLPGCFTGSLHRSWLQHLSSSCTATWLTLGWDEGSLSGCTRSHHRENLPRVNFLIASRMWKSLILPCILCPFSLPPKNFFSKYKFSCPGLEYWYPPKAYFQSVVLSGNFTPRGNIAVFADIFDYQRETMHGVGDAELSILQHIGQDPPQRWLLPMTIV